MKRHFLIQDRFFTGAKALRAEFDRRFGEPKDTRSDRFVWDYWHVPGQYTFVRTPADHFFPQNIYQSFLRRLTSWGQETLGCSAITPPWLSYYVQGCRQELHSDVPHGPWAFVFSLSPKKAIYRGGETLLLRPETLDYWRHFQDAEDREANSFLQKIPSPFNRLTVFDPRIPHGVSQVEGTLDPREGRLVVHGWFTEPRPYLKGALSARQAAPILDEAVERFVEALSEEGQWHGTVSLRLKVSAAGQSGEPKILADTLVPLAADPGRAAHMRAMLRHSFRGLSFPRAKAVTEITLPLLFR